MNKNFYLSHYDENDKFLADILTSVNFLSGVITDSLPLAKKLKLAV